jgi:hypothetical protein
VKFPVGTGRVRWCWGKVLARQGYSLLLLVPICDLASFSEELALTYNPLEEDLVCPSAADLHVRALRLGFSEMLLFFCAELKRVQHLRLIGVALKEHLEESLTSVCDGSPFSREEARHSLMSAARRPRVSPVWLLVILGRTLLIACSGSCGFRSASTRRV